MNTLSVILITKNEASNICSCLESVAWADELIVVDSGSTDGTVAIARAMGAKVFEHDWPGFGMQKNRALSYVSMDWVLSVDADERVSMELRAEILSVLKEPKTDGYFIPRLSQFCGTFIHHCGWYPDYVLRLFRRDKGRFSDSLVHESVQLDGRSEKLTSDLLHYSYIDDADVDRKVEHYSNAAARQMFLAGKRSGLPRAFLSAVWAFLRTYVIRMGVLDGLAGWHISKMNAHTTWLKYSKLHALHSGKNH